MHTFLSLLDAYVVTGWMFSSILELPSHEIKYYITHDELFIIKVDSKVKCQSLPLMHDFHIDRGNHIHFRINIGVIYPESAVLQEQCPPNSDSYEYCYNY